MVRIDTKDFNESIRQVKKLLDEHKMKLGDLITPFLSESLSKKEVVELCNLGKFILQINDEIKILSKNESPDFLVENNGELVGVEIEAIFNTKFVQDVKSKQRLLENAAIEFRERFPDINLFVNFQFKNNFIVRQADKKGLIEKIINYIHSFITSGDNHLKPSFVESIYTMKHSRLNFSYDQGAYFVNHIDDKLIEEAIQKKENKYENYVANSKTTHQWLLITIDSGANESYVIDEDKSIKHVSSKFKRIYILEDFSNRITKIK